MDDLKIIKLTDKNNKYFDTICNWMYRWWGEYDGWSIEKVICYMSNSLLDNKLPQTTIAIFKNSVVGMYQISMHDLDSRPDIYPWLINLYVDEKHRKKGIGDLLIKNAIKQAKKLTLSEIYLYTKHTGLYEKYGWKFIEEIQTFKKNSPIERLYKLNLI